MAHNKMYNLSIVTAFGNFDLQITGFVCNVENIVSLPSESSPSFADATGYKSWIFSALKY